MADSVKKSSSDIDTQVGLLCDQIENIWQQVAETDGANVRNIYERIAALHNNCRTVYQTLHPGKPISEAEAITT